MSKRATDGKRLLPPPPLLIVVVAMLWLALACSSVSGQFFTKSSKSIPRMGRRSPAVERSEATQPLRRLLIDSLLDQYGPRLVDAIEARANALAARQADVGKLYLQSATRGQDGGGEFVLPNEQPYSIHSLVPVDQIEQGNQLMDHPAAMSANTNGW